MHGEIVNELESKIAEYVGAKYAVSLNSASSAIFLSLLNKNETIIDEEHNLNKYIRNKKAKLNIIVQLLVSLITFLNKYLKLPNFLDRILTLCAFNK